MTSKEELERFINEMDYTLKDKIKANRKYAPQVFYKNKYTLENIVKDLERLEKQDKILELLKKRIASKDEYHITFRINACFKNEYDLIMDWVNNNGK